MTAGQVGTEDGPQDDHGLKTRIINTIVSTHLSSSLPFILKHILNIQYNVSWENRRNKAYSLLLMSGLTNTERIRELVEQYKPQSILGHSIHPSSRIDQWKLMAAKWCCKDGSVGNLQRVWGFWPQTDAWECWSGCPSQWPL